MPDLAIEFGKRAVDRAFEQLHVTDCALATTSAHALFSLDLRLSMEVSRATGMSLALAGCLLYRTRRDRLGGERKDALLLSRLSNFLTLIDPKRGSEVANVRDLGQLVDDVALLRRAALDKGGAQLVAPADGSVEAGNDAMQGCVLRA